jgi:hypothetical protein
MEEKHLNILLNSFIKDPGIIPNENDLDIQASSETVPL